jgi:YD repeat-containing protein
VVGNSLSYVYDRHGRVQGKSQRVDAGNALSVRYERDAQGRLDRMVLPSGAVVGYGYGADGRVLRITVNGVEIVREVEHVAFGGVLGWRHGPDGQRYRREIDADGRIAAHTLGDDTRRLSFDAAERIVGISDEAGAPWSNVSVRPRHLPNTASAV